MLPFPAQRRIVGPRLLHRLVHCAIDIGLGIANTAASKMQTGGGHRLGDDVNAVATIEGHLARDHAVELPWRRVWKALLEFVRQHTIFLDRVEANHWPPRLMGRHLDSVMCLACKVTHL
jgi:hypothetical protein